MYGLPNVGIIAQKLLKEGPKKHGYKQNDQTPDFRKHDTHPISFTLIVDDFGMKYIKKEHADHLIWVLEEFYEVEKDWKGKKYCPITLNWDYNQRKVHLPMPGYCTEALI